MILSLHRKHRLYLTKDSTGGLLRRSLPSELRDKQGPTWQSPAQDHGSTLIQSLLKILPSSHLVQMKGLGRTCWRRGSRRPPCCTHCPPPPRPPACQVHLDHDDHNVTTWELLLKSHLRPPITKRRPLRMATEKLERGSNMSATLTARSSR